MEYRLANKDKKKHTKARDGIIIDSDNEIRRLQEQYNTLVVKREAEVERMATARLPQPFDFQYAENRLKLDQKILSGKISQAANAHFTGTALTSINYLIDNGRLEDVVAYAYEGAGAIDLSLRSAVLDAIAQAGKVNELVSAVADQPNIRGSIFSDALRSRNFGLAYKLNNSKFPFEKLVIPHINDGESLMKYFNSIDDKTAASKSTAKILSYYLEYTVGHVGNLDRVFHDNKMLQDLTGKLASNASIDDKINVASILADAMVEIDNGKLTPEQKAAAKEALERVYEESCHIEGQENPLGVILQKYEQKDVYNALKVATHEKLTQAGSAANSAQDAAQVILYAPNLESFVRTRDILNKVVRKEGLEEGLSIGDRLRDFFATIARACGIEYQPDPKELTDLAAYVVGIKRTTDLKSPEAENARAIATGGDVSRGRF